METQKQGEPTMEEILASIRRIISEDGQPAGETADAGPANDHPDILELTEVVSEMPEPTDAGPGRSRGAQDEIDAIMGMDAAPAAPEEEPPAEPAREQEPAASAKPPSAADALVSSVAAAASGAALAGLAAALPGRRPLSGESPVGGATLEDLVRELLRPMLKEWLDANLPDMVERLVQREIERIARRAEER